MKKRMMKYLLGGGAMLVTIGICSAAEASVEAPRESMTSTLLSPLMLPLYAASVLLVALLLERARALRTALLIDRTAIKEALEMIHAGRLEAAVRRAGESITTITQAWHRGIKEHLQTGDDLKECLSRSCVSEFKGMLRRLQIITAIGVVSPLFGLLGTVIGMIMSFMQISIAGGADKAKLAEGIGFALFTTAGGLLVAIPAILGNRWFQFRILGLSDEVEDLIHHASVSVKTAGVSRPVERETHSINPAHEIAPTTA